MKVPFSPVGRTNRPSTEVGFLTDRTGIGASSQGALAQSMGQAANTLAGVGSLLSEQAKQARKFGTLQSFTEFQTQADVKMQELKRGADPRQGNFADQATAIYNNMETDWLKTVPDEFHDEFKTRATEVRGNVARSALAFQYERTDAYFKQGVADAVDTSLSSLDQDGGTANLERQRATIDEFINNTSLTDAEKVAQRRSAYARIEGVSYKSEVRRGNIEAGALGVGTAPGQASDLIVQFDGKSLENGLTYDENQQAVASRVGEAEQVAVKAIGSVDTWAALPDRARAVLISVTDDLGELPKSVKEAVATGDLAEVANAVADLGGDRRAQEAQILMGTANMPEGQLDADPRYANIPYEDRLALRADADREAAAMQAQAAKEAKAAQDAAINDLSLQLHDGAAGQYQIDQAREAGVLTDYADVKRLEGIIADQNKTLVMIQEGQAKLANGDTFNPGDEGDRNRLNALVGPQGLALMQQHNADFGANVIVPLVRQSGDVPTDTAGLLTGMIRAQDPKKAMYALDLMNQIQQASPEAYNARFTEAARADVEYWRSIKDYYPQDEVLAAVRGGTTQEERTKTTMLREEARGLLKDGKVDTNILPILSDMPQQQWGDAAMTAGTSQALSADFNELFEREYARDGNQTAARERTIKALGTVWNTTNVGGQQTLMKYPPELVGYPTWNKSHDWITEQGRADLGISADTQFQLISDEQTKAEFTAWQGGQGAPPSYLAVYKDESGNLVMPTVKERGAGGEVLGDTGQVQRIFFQVTPEMEAKQAGQLAADTKQQQYEEFMNIYNSAQRHSINTGTPIPQDIQDEYASWADYKAPADLSRVFQTRR